EPEPSLLRVTALGRVSTGQRCCTSGEAATAAARAFISRALPCLAMFRNILAPPSKKRPNPALYLTVGLEAQEFVSTTVGGTSARHIRPPQFARVMRRLRRLHCPKRAVSSGYRASPRLRLVEL